MLNLSNCLKDITASSCLVKEPLESVLEEINEASSKVILSGNRGSGKTTILKYLESESIITKSPFLFVKFDSISFGPDEGFFSLSFWNHYYELVICSKLLDYIQKRSWPQFPSEFLEYKETVNRLILEVDNYIQNYCYKDISLSRMLTTGELLTKIIKDMKSHFGLSSVNLLIDRFDWTNGKREVDQYILKTYFALFGKVVITSDDETLIDEDKANALYNQGFSIVDVDYGKDSSILKEIIVRRMREYKSLTIKNTLPIEFITDEVLEYLIKVSNGNISLIINIIADLDLQYAWKADHFSIDTLLDSCADEHLKTDKMLKLMSKPPILHI